MDRTVAPGAASSGSIPLRNARGYMNNIIDGKMISKEIINECKMKIDIMKQKGKSITLVDIYVGDDKSSEVYINSKIKKFNEVGISFNLVKCDKNITEDELINKIEYYNNDKTTNAIFVERPLPQHINEINVIDKISFLKDVDGFSKMSMGSLLQGSDGFYPCTALSIVELIKMSNIDISGKNCVVVGRSNTVGKPVAMLLLRENATVTICHSKTKNIKDICKTADILIVAIGKAKYIDDSYIKENAVVIDAGINEIEVNGEKKICGDVDFEKVSNHTSYITPVPGGVGPMTTAILIRNCIKCIKDEQI